MKYDSVTQQSYNIPLYEILRTQMLAHKDEWLTARELRNLTGLNSKTLKFYLRCAINLGYVNQNRKRLGKTNVLRGMVVNTYKNNSTYKIVSDSKWYNISRAKNKLPKKTQPVAPSTSIYSSPYHFPQVTSPNTRA